MYFIRIMNFLNILLIILKTNNYYDTKSNFIYICVCVCVCIRLVFLIVIKMLFYLLYILYE